MTTTASETPNSGQMLCGTKSIAQFLGIKPRAARSMLDDNLIPHFRVGRRICAAPGKLSEWVEQQHQRPEAA